MDGASHQGRTEVCLRTEGRIYRMCLGGRGQDVVGGRRERQSSRTRSRQS